MPNVDEKLRAASPKAGDLEGTAPWQGGARGQAALGQVRKGRGAQASSPSSKDTAEPLAWNAPSPSGITDSSPLVSLLLHRGEVMGSP